MNLIAPRRPDFSEGTVRVAGLFMAPTRTIAVALKPVKTPRRDLRNRDADQRGRARRGGALALAALAVYANTFRAVRVRDQLALGDKPSIRDLTRVGATRASPPPAPPEPSPAPLVSTHASP